MEYRNKYLKYKNKYLELKSKLNQRGGDIIVNSSDYEKAFKIKNTDAKVQNLVGRVLRGTLLSEFEYLSPDVNRKLIMFMDSEGLEKLIGKSSIEILETIGYPKQYIEDLLSKNTKFKLLVTTKGEKILRGTWDNLLILVKQLWSSTRIPEYLERNLDELKKHSNKQGWKKIMEKKELGFSNKMTSEELDKRKGELWEVRLFLNDVLNLNELFSGDGYTYNDRGEKGLAEYFSINQPISNLGDYKLIDLEF
jgi:hypothetical protein